MKRLFPIILIFLGSILVPIQNSSAATTIGGIVNSDLILNKSQGPYSLSSTLQIPAGVKVTVEAGVEIQSNGLETMFWNQGILTFKGTRENPIRLTGKPSIYVLTKNSVAGSQLNISGVLFNGGRRVWSNEGFGGSFDLIFEDNEVKDVTDFIYVWYLLNKAVIQRNVFINSGGLSVGFNQGKDVSILNNLFIGPSTTGYWVESWASFGGQLEVHKNEFRGGPYIAVQLKPDYKDAKINATSNYWGTQSIEDISKMVNDRNDSLSYINTIDISGPLAQSAIGTPTSSILQADKASAEREELRILLDSVAAQISSMKSKYGENPVRTHQVTLDRLYQALKAVDESGYSEIRLLAQKTQAQLIALDQSVAKGKVSAKKSTITCLNGKVSKKVSAVNPRCPVGYKQK